MRFKGQERADDGTGQVGHMVRNVIVPAADLGEQCLWVSVKEWVVTHKKSVEDDAQAPHVRSLPRVTARL